MPNSQVTYTYDVDARIRCDNGYIKTIEGIMKLILQVQSGLYEVDHFPTVQINNYDITLSSYAWEA